MKKLIVLSLLIATAAFASDSQSGRRFWMANDETGVPTFVSGELGRLAPGPVEKSAQKFLESRRAMLKMTGAEQFEPVSSFRDELGQTHVKLQQQLRGLPVIGGEYVLHADAEGRVLAINGRLAVDRDLPRAPRVGGWSAITQAAEQAGIRDPKFEGWPRLVYVVNEKGNAYLAWAAKASFTDDEGPHRDTLYADATTGDLVLRDSDFKYARNRRTYNLNHGTSLPGTLVLTETSGSTSDSAIQSAHDNAGTTYDYYSQVHGRDSFNGSGAIITSSVHYSSNYNNAYWDGSQMVYGDGDGSTFTFLSLALDVDGHELTHAVTQYSANLIYSNESGALNEATSDIMASAIEAWSDGSVSTNTWKVGEDVYTPGTSGDALRYMDDPALAGDRDYYPTRYTGSSDNGGVHTNSGIANLAFYLMVHGGTHPRGKTTVNVPALNSNQSTSINMGARIWYRALTVYMTSSTNFQGARNATASAASDLYGSAAEASVQAAWDAVGAPGGSGGGGGGTTTLSNGVPVTGISASTGNWNYFKITVPSGQSSLQITQSGGTGDADLYVKLGSQPTLSSYDYRPYLNGNNESVSVTNPAAGDWYIGIEAYSSYSGVSLVATYSGSGGGGGCTTYTGTLSGTGSSSYQPSTSGYTAGAGAHTATLTGPANADFDLYLYKKSGSRWNIVARSEGSTSNESINYTGTSGTYRWRVYSYSGSGSFSLCASHP